MLLKRRNNSKFDVVLRTTTLLGIPLGLQIVLSFCLANFFVPKACRRAGRVVDLKVPNIFVFTDPKQDTGSKERAKFPNRHLVFIMCFNGKT